MPRRPARYAKALLAAHAARLARQINQRLRAEKKAASGGSLGGKSTIRIRATRHSSRIIPVRNAAHNEV